MSAKQIDLLKIHENSEFLEQISVSSMANPVFPPEKVHLFKRINKKDWEENSQKDLRKDLKNQEETCRLWPYRGHNAGSSSRISPV